MYVRTYIYLYTCVYIYVDYWHTHTHTRQMRIFSFTQTCIAWVYWIMYPCRHVLEVRWNRVFKFLSFHPSFQADSMVLNPKYTAADADVQSHEFETKIEAKSGSSVPHLPMSWSFSFGECASNLRRLRMSRLQWKTAVACGSGGLTNSCNTMFHYVSWCMFRNCLHFVDKAKLRLVDQKLVQPHPRQPATVHWGLLLCRPKLPLANPTSQSRISWFKFHVIPNDIEWKPSTVRTMPKKAFVPFWEPEGKMMDEQRGRSGGCWGTIHTSQGCWCLKCCERPFILVDLCWKNFVRRKWIKWIALRISPVLAKFMNCPGNGPSPKRLRKQKDASRNRTRNPKEPVVCSCSSQSPFLLSAAIVPQQFVAEMATIASQYVVVITLPLLRQPRKYTSWKLSLFRQPLQDFQKNIKAQSDNISQGN